MIVHVPRKKDKAKQRNGTLYIRLIPDSVKNYFKAYCAKRGKSMSEVIVDFMKQTVTTAQKLDAQRERENRK